MPAHKGLHDKVQTPLFLLDVRESMSRQRLTMQKEQNSLPRVARADTIYQSSNSSPSCLSLIICRGQTES